MKNITLAIDEDTLERGEEYAKRHHTSLNGLVQGLLEREVKPDYTNMFEEMFRLIDEASAHKDCLADDAYGNSEGRTWTKEEIHERSFGREPKLAPHE
jgi:hypothetical protein